MDVDGYKIVNAYKPLPTRLQASDLVSPHPCLYAGDFNCPHADWCYGANSLDGECLAAWASINNLALLYYPKDFASFHSGCWNSGTNLDLALAGADSDSRSPDRRVLKKFPKSQYRPSLITSPRFALPVPSMPVKRWNFHIVKWSHYIALINKFAKTLLPLIHRTWIKSTMTSAKSSAQQSKDLSHVVVETTTNRAGIQSVRASTEYF